MHHSKSNLIREYGLTEYTYDALSACVAPTYWKQASLNHSIASLYNLRDRGLLSGPKTGKPYSIPFHLTEAGRDMLARIERGLHKPEWLNQHKARALAAIQTGAIGKNSMADKGIRQITLNSLVKAGYILDDDRGWWALTDLGREAWQELIQNDPPSPSGRGAGGEGL